MFWGVIMIVQNINALPIPFNSIVKHSREGNIHSIMGYTHKSTGNGIRKISSDCYINLSSPFINPEGEFLLSDSSAGSFFDSFPDVTSDDFLFQDGYGYLIQNYRPTENRSQSPNEIRKTFKRLRSIINTNVTDSRKCKFITLTYKENMTDSDRLRYDLKLFIKRFKWFVEHIKNNKGNNLGLTFEYISVLEPQQRGAWHAHIIFIFNKQVRFIYNEDVARIWSHGFTTTRRIDNVDNVGAYLCAYLADIEVTDSVDNQSIEFLQSTQSNVTIKECVVPDYDRAGSPKGKAKKKFIKGGRLYLYPKGFHLYRCSKGIKRPEVVYHTYKEVLQELGSSASLTFHKSIHISDGANFDNTLTYMYYNTKRKINRKDARTSYNEVLRCANDFVQNRCYAPPVCYQFDSDGVDVADYNSADILRYLENRNSINMRC